MVQKQDKPALQEEHGIGVVMVRFMGYAPSVGSELIVWHGRTGGYTT